MHFEILQKRMKKVYENASKKSTKTYRFENRREPNPPYRYIVARVLCSTYIRSGDN